MINRILIILLFLVGCQKEDIVEQVTYNPPTSDLFLDDNFIDYSLPSYFTRIPFPETNYNYRNFSNWHPPLEAILVDYDKDGYLDIVEGNSDYGSDNASSFIFMKGNKYGSLVKNVDNIFTGLVGGRKGITGDFNSDGFPDLFFVDMGNDTPPYYGGHNVLMTNNGDGSFDQTRYTEYVSYYHSAASGDLDNDGDLDIFALGRFDESYILYNNNGEFALEPLWPPVTFPNTFNDLFEKKYHVEIIDYDNDGFDDIFLGGHEVETLAEDIRPSVILKGSQNGYNEVIELPAIVPYGVVTDLDFYDLNNDNVYDIVVTRAGVSPWYHNYYIQIIDGATLEDITLSYFPDKSNKGYSGDGKGWIFWISVYKKNNQVIISSDDMFHNIKWTLDSNVNQFKKN